MIPKVFAWYASDFAHARGIKASAVECAEYAANFLQKKARVRVTVAATTFDSIKYLPFSFHCRTLSLLTDEEMAPHAA